MFALRFFLATLIVTLCTVAVHAQNIYSGGNDDGFAKDSYIEADPATDIYAGGADDGFASNAYIEPDPATDIYAGGIDDGFAKDSYVEADPATDIYAGGADDGFASNTYIESDPAIDIYYGGIGDGFAKNEYGSLGDEKPLPVELLFFTVSSKDNTAVIAWATASETNNSHFIVEKSKDAETIEVVETVMGKGTTTNITEYEIVDSNPYLQTSYYRIKQVDYNNQYTYSSWIRYKNEDEAYHHIQLFPNPNSGVELNIVMNGVDHNNSLMIELYDLKGNLVLRKHTNSDIAESSNYTLVFQNKVPSGVYTIKITHKKGVEVQRFVVL